MNALIDFLIKIGLIFDPGVSQVFSSGGEPFYVSFEGLGIGQFRVNPVAIPIFNGIRFYGIIITIAIILAFLYVAKWRAKDAGYHFDDLLDFVLIVVPVGVLGARLFYVFTSEGYNWSNWYRIWDGGLAIYGGIIGGIAAIIGVGIYKKVRILRLMDCTAPAVMIAQALGRWGNFFNGEAYGAETTSFLRMGLSNTLGGQQFYVHPTFLYESLWNVLGFVLINVFFKKKKFDGQIVLEYLGWYGLGRFFIELLRQDSLPLHIGSYDLRISSVIGFLCFLICLVIFIVLIVRPRSATLDLPCYHPGAKRLILNEKEAAQKAAESVQEKPDAGIGGMPGQTGDGEDAESEEDGLPPEPEYGETDGAPDDAPDGKTNGGEPPAE
ncbi:MAG: prolipoprotein diacylglyceryl transferase [Clostridia bacterium]|nr:prolipoprotein diacylglyceryl transferase [Clostridia bacterium]